MWRLRFWPKRNWKVLPFLWKFCFIRPLFLCRDHSRYNSPYLFGPLKLAVKISLENPSVLKVGGASLDFYHYYVIEHKLEMSKNDPLGKKHNIQNREMVIVDAFNGELLSLSDKKRKKFVNKLNPFPFSKECGFSI